MKVNPTVANVAIERVLDLSAEAHIDRRKAARNSASFHKLTGAIAAYGEALAVLVSLQEREEFLAMLAELDVSEFVTGTVN